METLGGLIDKLSVVNIRIWFAEDIKRNKNASDKQIADACRITNVANSHRNDLIQEIDELINSMILSKTPQRLYKQGSTKLYGNDAPEFDRCTDAVPPKPAEAGETLADAGLDGEVSKK
jgi:hypothetical protein